MILQHSALGAGISVVCGIKPFRLGDLWIFFQMSVGNLGKSSENKAVWQQCSIRNRIDGTIMSYPVFSFFALH